MAPTIGKRLTDARTEPSNATWYDSLPVVTRLTNASIALTNGRGVGDGFGGADAVGTAAVRSGVHAVGAGRQPPATTAARTAADIASERER